MRFNLNRFSKYFLAALLAASLCMAGCSNNPSSSDNGENQDPTDPSNTPKQAEDSSSKTHTLFCSIIPTTSDSPNDKDIVFDITMENIITKKKYPTTSTGYMFGFEEIIPGYYKIEVTDNKKMFFKTESIYQKIDTDIDDLFITVTPKNTTTPTQVSVSGRLIDINGEEIPFAKITATNTKTNKVYQTSTGFNNGEYVLSNLPLGSYKVVYSKDSFNDSDKIDLTITDTTTINFNGKSVSNNKLSDVTLTYKLMPTGSIAGVLSGYSSGKCSLYKTRDENASTKPGLTLTFTPQSNGYFYIKNLQPGWYCITKESVTITAIPGEGGTIAGYQFADGDQYFTWMEVVNDTTTPVPSMEQ